MESTPKKYEITAENMDKLSNKILEIPTKYGVELIAILQTSMIPVEACSCHDNRKEAKGNE